MTDAPDYAGLMEEAAQEVESARWSAGESPNDLACRLRAAAARYREEAGKAVGLACLAHGRLRNTLYAAKDWHCTAQVYDMKGNPHDCGQAVPLFAVPVGATKKETDRDLIGLCPHGYLKCFYCWRDAGFPGEANG